MRRSSDFSRLVRKRRLPVLAEGEGSHHYTPLTNRWCLFPVGGERSRAVIRKRQSLNPGKVLIIFEIPSSIWAERINLVGDFNDWDAESLPFRQNRVGDWQIELELDVGKEYHFRYLLDGEHWRDDWHADGHVPNPHGGYDSVVIAEVRQET